MSTPHRFYSRLDSVEAVTALDAGELDVAFVRLDRDAGHGIAAMPIAKETLAVAVSRDHPFAELARVRFRSGRWVPRHVVAAGEPRTSMS
ncbi:LysR substrate-binding domain-containing protein [Paraburkholderia caledonica]|uniref:LysR substrate-binding domain-containing protein n=1 Tax=Paraburkholderia caledonica TaxID=134536 RepID=UPI00370988D5